MTTNNKRLARLYKTLKTLERTERNLSAMQTFREPAIEQTKDQTIASIVNSKRLITESIRVELVLNGPTTNITLEDGDSILLPANVLQVTDRR